MTRSLVTATGGATLFRGRKYGGVQWHPDAWEQFPRPFRALQAYVCRDVGENSMLLARIEYEKTKVTDADVLVLRQLLDDIGEAVDRKLARK